MKGFIFCLWICGLLFGLGFLGCFITYKTAEKSFFRDLCEKLFLPMIAGLLAIVIPITFMSGVFKPQPQDILPAWALPYDMFWPNTEEYYDENPVALEADIQTLSHELQTQPTNELLFKRALLYFKSKNFDLARSDMIACQDAANPWEYAYDLGVCHCYLQEYEDALTCFRSAINQDDISFTERGDVLDIIKMVESYYYGWLYSLVG